MSNNLVYNLHLSEFVEFYQEVYLSNHLIELKSEKSFFIDDNLNKPPFLRLYFAPLTDNSPGRELLDIDKIKQRINYNKFRRLFKATSIIIQ